MLFTRISTLFAAAVLASLAIAGPIHIRRSYDDEVPSLFERDLILDSESDLAVRTPMDPTRRGAHAANVIKAQNGVNPSAPPPSNPQDRAAVSAHLRKAGAAYDKVANKPGRKDSFTSGDGRNAVTHTGNDVRKAVFNSQVHAAAPVGGGRAPDGRTVPGNPKHFGNYPYKNGPINGNTHPIPAAAKQRRLTEFPVVSNPAGWHGDSSKGPARVVASNSRVAGVVAHPSRNNNNHVQMDHVPASRKDWANNADATRKVRP